MVLHDPARRLDMDLAAVRTQSYNLGILQAEGAQGKWIAFLTKGLPFYGALLLRQEERPWPAGTPFTESWHSFLWRFYGSSGRRSLQSAESRVSTAARAWNVSVTSQVYAENSSQAVEDNHEDVDVHQSGADVCSDRLQKQCYDKTPFSA